METEYERDETEPGGGEGRGERDRGGGGWGARTTPGRRQRGTLSSTKLCRRWYRFAVSKTCGGRDGNVGGLRAGTPSPDHSSPEIPPPNPPALTSF